MDYADEICRLSRFREEEVSSLCSTQGDESYQNSRNAPMTQDNITTGPSDATPAGEMLRTKLKGFAGIMRYQGDVHRRQLVQFASSIYKLDSQFYEKENNRMEEEFWNEIEGVMQLLQSRIATLQSELEESHARSAAHAANHSQLLTHFKVLEEKRNRYREALKDYRESCSGFNHKPHCYCLPAVEALSPSSSPQ